MLMMMMMMKKKGLKTLAVMAAVLAAVSCIVIPSNEELTQMSLRGEKYLDEQIENAVNGVKEMKSVMEKSSDDHKRFLDALEKTKEQKEEAIRVAQDVEAKLEQEEEVCNDTMRSLWEECKPCLKNTCVKYYSRTCSSGSGLVGRQLEEVLNRTSPFSIWINGEKIDTLEQEGQRQNKELKNLEDKYVEMADGVDSIFTDSMKVPKYVHSSSPVFFMPSFLGPFTRRSRSIPTLLRDPFQGFQGIFSPMSGLGRNFFSSMGSMMDIDSDTPSNEDGSVNEDVVITKPFGNGRMTCREIRRNSAGCIRFRDECQKCKDIQHIDCSGKKPLEGPLKAELEEALALAERFTRQYNNLLKRFEEQMFNTSSILDLLNAQFGWVSSLANKTDSKDNFFRVQTVISREAEKTPGEEAAKEKQPEDTKVSVQLFDSQPMNFTVPGHVPWTDPKFPELVAQEALDRFKESTVIVK